MPPRDVRPSKVEIMLEETKLPYRVHDVDLKAGEHKTPAFLALNATGRIPAILDDDPQTGPALALAETLAITLYLAEKSGRLIPQSLEERALSYQGAATIISGFGAATPGIVFARQLGEAAHEKIIAKVFGDIELYLRAMDAHLASSRYLSGDSVSFADVLAIPTIAVSLKTFKVDLQP
jgi:GST-like protein